MLTRMRKCLPPLFCALLVFSVSGASFARPAETRSQVILVIANRLTFSDLTQNTPPTIARMVRDGSIGLVSPHPGRRRSLESAFLSIGAASSFVGSQAVHEAHDASETVEGFPASDVYHRRMGLEAPPGSVVHVALERLVRVNENKRAIGTPGMLGEALRRNDKRVAVFGNSDTSDERCRPAVVVAMDSRGVVAEGEVGPGMLRADPQSPTGESTDIPRLLKAVKQSAASADLIVIDFGDTERLETYKPRISDTAHAQYRAVALKKLDGLLAALLSIRGERITLMLVSVMPPMEDSSVDQFSPMVIYRSHLKSGSSVLTSASTRTDGLVCAIDIAPTILSELSTPLPTDTLGKPMTSRFSPRRMDDIQRFNSRAGLYADAQMPILGTIAGLGVVALTALGLLVVFRVRPATWALISLRGLVVVLTAAPLAMLPASVYNGNSVAGYAAAVVACDLLLVLVAVGLAALFRTPGGKSDWPIPAVPAMVSLITVVVLALDILAGARLGKYSLVGSYPLTGLRFYGVGNEYMGVLIGHTALAALWLRQRLPNEHLSLSAKVVFAIALSLVVLIIGLPDLGANVGGAIAAVVGLGLCYRALTNKIVDWKNTLVMFVIGLALVAAFAVSDLYLRGGLASHAGHTAGEVEHNGWQHICATAARKMTFNLQLLSLRHSETAILAFVPFFALWFCGAQQRVNSMFKGRPELANGFKAMVIGAAAAFLFNDSGVVAASIILSVPVVALLYSLVGENPIA